MKYLSVCSGIEAASVAWHPLGWEPLAFSEIEPFPRAVLAHHYPDTPLHGDFTVLREMPFIVDADVLVGGTPCQAFSVAGLRNSLADDRGNLSLEFVRLADAIDDVRRAASREPGIVVWENVPGVLSVRDNAFGSFLAGLAGEDTALVPTGGRWTDAGVVDGPGRRIAWRVLDAQYFGLAQRRRRVFVIASARDGFDPAAVLLEFEGVRRDTPPRREAGQVAPTIPSRSTAGGGLGTDFDCDGGVIRAFAGTVESDVAATIQTTCHDYSRADGFNMVAHALRAEGFDASENGTGRAMPLVPTTYSIMPQNSGKDYKAREVEVAQPIMAGGPVGGNKGGDYVLQPVAYRTTGNDGVYETGDLVHALTTATDPNSHVIGFSAKDHGGDAIEELAPTLRAGGADKTHANSGNWPGVAYAFQPRIARNGRGDMGEVVNALNAQSGETGKGDAALCVATFQQSSMKGKGTIGYDDSGIAKPVKTQMDGQMLHQHMAVRRLTPVERSRLQGFPDDYLLSVTWRGKCPPPDGPMYKALGNSMAVPCMRWIGRRIAAELARQHQEKAA